MLSRRGPGTSKTLERLLDYVYTGMVVQCSFSSKGLITLGIGRVFLKTFRLCIS
ncbi:unnamed protein product [Ixodes pacificus]